MPITQQDVLAALRSIKEPELHRDIVTLGMVKGIEIDGTRVVLAIELTSPASPLKETLRREIAAALANTDSTEFHLNLTVRPLAAPGTAPHQQTAGAGGASACPIRSRRSRSVIAVVLARAASAKAPSPSTSPLAWPERVTALA